MGNQENYWHASSYYSGNRGVSEEEEDMYMYLNLFSEFNLDHSDRIHKQYYASIFIFILSVIAAVVTGIMAIITFSLLSLIGMVHFRRRKPQFLLRTMSKVYWPIALVVRPDDKRVFFDPLGHIDEVTFLQFGYATKVWEQLTTRIQNISQNNITRTLRLLDLTVLSMVCDYIRSDKLNVIHAENTHFKKIFLESENYAMLIDRNYKPNGLLVDTDLDLYRRQVDYMNELDNYSRKVLRISAELRIATSELTKPLNEVYYEEIESLYKRKLEQKKALEETQLQISLAFQPIRSLLRRQFEPQKIVLETALNLSNSQIDMSNFLYAEQLKLSTKKEDLKSSKEAKLEAEKTFGNVKQYNDHINKLNRESEKVENEINRVKSRILQLESDISSTKRDISDLENRLRRASAMDDIYTVNLLRSRISSEESKLNRLISEMNSARSKLESLIKDLGTIASNIKKSEAAKRELILMKKKSSKERAEMLKKRKIAEKETANKSQSKAESLQDSNKQKIQNEVDLLMNLLASTEVQFTNINQQFSLFAQYGVEEEFNRKVEGFYSILTYVNLRTMAISNLLRYADERILNVMKKRNGYYNDFQFPNEKKGMFGSSGFICLPIWVVEIFNTRNGRIENEFYLGSSVTQAQISGMKKFIGYGSGISFKAKNIHDNALAKYLRRNYENYVSTVVENNVLTNISRVSDILKRLDDLMLQGFIGKHTNRWLKLFVKVKNNE